MAFLKNFEAFINETYVREPKGFLINPTVTRYKILKGISNNSQETTQYDGLHSLSGARNDAPEAHIGGRNKKIIDILNGIRFDINDFLHPITGAPYLKRSDLDPDKIPSYACDFFQKKGNLLDGGGRTLSGRGLHYYFQFPGIQVQGNPLSMKDFTIETTSSEATVDITQYTQSILDHFDTVRTMRHNWGIELHPNRAHLSDSAKRGLLILLDHEKNIILFLINVLTILLDAKFLNEQALGKLVFNKEQAKTLIHQDPKGFEAFETLRKEILGDKEGVLRKLYILMSITESQFTGLMENNFMGLPGSTVTNDMNTEVKKIVLLLENFLSFLHTSTQNGKITSKTKKTNWDAYWETGVSKILRFSREEDDIRSMKFSAISLAKKIIDDFGRYSVIEIYGLLYGGAEFPFILNEELIHLGFRGKIIIRLVTYSIYDIKNKTHGFSLDDYPAVKLFDREWYKLRKIDTFLERVNDRFRYIMGWEKNFTKGTYAVLLDDNIFSGDTLLGFEKLLKDSGHYDDVLSQVATLMIDSRTENGMKQNEGLMYHQLSHAGNVLPVWNNNESKYANPINSLVGKRIAAEKQVHKMTSTLSDE